MCHRGADGICVYPDVSGGCVWAILRKCVSCNGGITKHLKLHFVNCRLPTICEIGLWLVSDIRSRPHVYNRLMCERGTMVIALMCIAALPVPLFIYKFGSKLRAKDAKRFSDVEDEDTKGSTGSTTHKSQEGFQTPPEEKPSQ